MRRTFLAALTSLVFAAAAGGVASAHPLGNFTINHYAGLVVRADAVTVDYVIDMAEIPAFQERTAIDTDNDGLISGVELATYAVTRCALLRSGLSLGIDGRGRPLAVGSAAATLPPGQGGLSTLRLECGYNTALDAAAEGRLLEFADVNYKERLGWREITARGEGVELETTLPSASASARLAAYPQDLLSSPLDLRAGKVRLIGVVPSGDQALLPVGGAAPAKDGRPTDALASLISQADLSPLALVAALLVAFGLGAVHALSPGHGKTVMAAYLVSSRGSLRQAAVLGLAVAASHTAGVLCLGLITLTGTALIAPDRVYPYLSAISAGIVLALGAWLVGARVRHQLAPAHEHTNAHPHDGPRLLSWRALAALGLAGGIIPSASALLVLLGAINLHRVELGLVLIVAFGLGMAVTLVGIGTALVSAGRVGEARLASHAALRRLYAYVPAAAAVAVLLLGIGMTAQSLVALARP